MLRRVNAALFEAPPAARIQVVAEAQGNNGVNDARFEYAGRILPREKILGLPGCSFTVAGSSERLEAVVVFDPGAPRSARYDLFEVENGVKSALQKFTKRSESAPLISFTIDPVLLAVAPPVPRVAVVRPSTARRPVTATAVKPKAATKKPAKKTAAAKKKAAKKKTGAKKTAARRKTSPKRRTSRTRAR